jgi:hypothetical protein
LSENETLVTAIQGRCIEDAGCWLWQGSCSNGHPYHRHAGKVVPVRRTLFTSLFGPLGEKIIRMECGSRLCINPQHMARTTRKKLCVKLAALMGGPIRAAKSAAFHRTGPHAKLTMDGVKRIRGSSETVASLALEHGVSQNTIRRVQQGAAWRDYSSPFAGLGAR